MPETKYKHNSMIKIKHCNCKPDCQRWPTKHCNGKNYNCLTDEEKQAIGTRNSIARKQKAYNQAQARMLHIAQKKVEEKKEGTPEWKLVLFYSSAAFELAKNPYCQETGEWIPPTYYRAATAHILPKSKFPSVAAHPKNRLFLSAGNGSHNKTHRWDTFSKMQVWPLAVEAFKEIYPYIAVEELKNLPNELLQTLVSQETVSGGNIIIDNSLNI